MSLADRMEAIASPVAQTGSLADRMENVSETNVPRKAIAPIEEPTWFERQAAKLPAWLGNPNARSEFVGEMGKSYGGTVAKGLLDAGTGIVQLGANAIGQGDAVNQRIADAESRYQQSRQDAMPQTVTSLVTGEKPKPGFDSGRLIGNIVPAVLAPQIRAAEGAGMLSRYALSGVNGAIQGAAQPVTNGAEGLDYAKEKALQIGAGALGGAVGAPVGEVLGKVAGAGINAFNAVRNKINGAAIPQEVSDILAKATPEFKAQVEKEIASGAKPNIEALKRQTEANSLPVPINLTPGQATRDASLYSTEQNIRGKTPALANHLGNQVDKLDENLHAIKKLVGPDVAVTDHIAGGEKLISAAKSADDKWTADISSKYKALADANGGKLPMDGTTFVDNAKKALDEAGREEFLPGVVKNTIEKYANGKPMTFTNFETLRTILAQETRKAERAGDGNAKYAIGLVRDSLENMPLSTPQKSIVNFDSHIANYEKSLPIDTYTQKQQLKKIKQDIEKSWQEGNVDEHTRTYGPDEIRKIIKSENKNNGLIDADGDYTDAGWARANALEDQLSTKLANEVVGPAKKEVADFSSPDHAANLLRDYLDKAGLNPNVVGGSGKSGSKYFELGDGRTIRVSDHELPDQYQKSHIDIVLPADHSKAIDVIKNSASQIIGDGSSKIEHLKQLADAARAAAKERFDYLKKTPAYDAAINDVQPDKFINTHIINGNVAQVRDYVKSIKGDPEALQTLKASVIDYLTPSGTGSVRQATLNNKIEAIAPKLEALGFSAQEISHIKTLGNVASYVQKAPNGGFVNSSNTLTGALDPLLTGAAEHGANILTGSGAGSALKMGANFAKDQAAAKAKQVQLTDMLKTGAGATSPAPGISLTRQAGQIGSIPLSLLLSKGVTNAIPNKQDNRN